jgi:enoyl-CoA hydratase
MSVTSNTEDRITVVTIDRPERRNAVDLVTALALIDAFQAFDRAETADVAILTGAGGTFCAGADLHAIAAGERKPYHPDGDFAPMGPTRLRLGKPVIAAIEGPAVAGGMELALWCDLRVAGRSALMGVFNRRFGVPLVDLGTIRLPQIVGQGRALEFILTGRPIAMDEALRIGLVNELTDDGAALGRAIELARLLTSFPQTAMRNDRLSVYEQYDLTQREATVNEIVRGRATIDSGEALSGSRRFAAGAGRHGRLERSELDERND